jgi:hypothetical protein
MTECKKDLVRMESKYTLSNLKDFHPFCLWTQKKPDHLFRQPGHLFQDPQLSVSTSRWVWHFL